MWRPYFVFGFGGSKGQVRMASFALRMVWKREERREGGRFHNFLIEGVRKDGRKEGKRVRGEKGGREEERRKERYILLASVGDSCLCQ